MRSTRTFATAASRYGSIEWSPRRATHVHATWRTLGKSHRRGLDEAGGATPGSSA